MINLCVCMWSSPANTLKQAHDSGWKSAASKHTGIWCVRMTSSSHIFTLIIQTYNNTETEEAHKHCIYQPTGPCCIYQGWLYRTEWTLGLLSDQVGHLLTREPASTFKMVNIDLSISVCIFLFPSMSQPVMTNPPPLVNVAVAYAAFKWGGINPSNNVTAQSSRLDVVMHSNPWWWKFPADFCFCVLQLYFRYNWDLMHFRN